MSKDPKELLRHIIDECSFITAVTENLLFDDFVQDETLKRAIVRSLEIIGEATKKIPADFKVKCHLVQWEKYGRNERQINSRLYWGKLFYCVGCGKEQNSRSQKADFGSAWLNIANE